MATEFYKVHGGRITFGEYWKMSPDPFTFLIASFMKPFGGFPFKFSIPRIDKLHIVALDDFPGGPRKILKKNMKRFEELGFTLAFCHELPLLERDRFGGAAVLLGPDGVSFATCNFVEEKMVSQTAINVACQFDDDSFGTATTQKEMMKPDPRHVTVRFPGAGPEELYDRFEVALKDWQEEGRNPIRMNATKLPGAILMGEAGHVDFHADRGVYIPMSKAEIRSIRQANGGYDD